MRIVATTTLCGALLVAANCSEETPKSPPISQEPADSEKTVEADFPGAVVYSEDGRITRVAGRTLATGADASASARAFLARYADKLGAEVADLDVDASASTRPIKYDRASDRYAFSLLTVPQMRDGLRVYGADVRLLVRNEAGSPLVSVTSRVKPLAGFVASVDSRRKTQPVDVQAATEQHLHTQVSIDGAPERVIWAGAEGQRATPRTALTYVAQAEQERGKWRMVVDAQDGTVLLAESLILFEDVNGTVEANVTDGFAAMDCAEDVLSPLGYAQASIVGGESAFGDLAGSFTIPHAGTDEVTVESPVAGQYFVVNDYVSSRNELLSASVLPPGPVAFEHNPAGGTEFVRAQSNVYYFANQVRDWVLSYNPSYPVIASQTQFPASVNRTDLYCPGNAWYDYSSINFCSSSSSYGNTSFASVVHHEYGHHLVASAGSGQGAYGEGMSDVVAMLIADDPRLGLGFFKDQCETPLRTADNDCQKTAQCSSCGSGSHACGQLLSGSIWSVRQELEDTYPGEGLEILASLVVNSIPLHSGMAIDEQIAIDLLTLDDNDADINNGTPHRAEICAGFEAHSIACPPLSVGLGVDGDPLESRGDVGGPFEPAHATYGLHNYGPGDIEYTVTADAPWLDISNGSGALPEEADVEVMASINAVAATLPKGEYTATVTFTNTTDHIGDHTETVTLIVGGPKPHHNWDLEVDPEWTTEGDWAFGVPAGSGGDPSSGHTGSNVYGYNLSGAYPANMSEQHLTTTAIDCSNLSQVSLHFERWLGVESNNWDHAYVRVSNDGTNWTTVWANPVANINDTSWTHQEFDLSAIADGQPTVYVRWTMGVSDSIIQFAGWNIDDIAIWGIADEDPQDCEADTDCDDGAFCNGTETCVDGTCSAGTAVDCSDSIECTIDTCNEVTDLCESLPDNSVCENGAFCDGAEQCTEAGCVAGDAPCEGDETCDEDADVCLGCTSDAECDDEVFCNGAEQCIEGACVQADPVECDDGVSCTNDACDEDNDQCSNEPDDTVCDDGAFCNGEETCDVELDCQPGTEPCEGECDEDEDTCSSVTLVIPADGYCLRLHNWNGGSHQSASSCWVGGYYRYPTISYDYEMLAGFDLDGISGEVASAALRFNTSSNIGVSTIRVVEEDQGAWNPNTVNYNTFPRTDWTSVLGTVSLSGVSSHELSSANLTALVQAWVDGSTPNDGLVFTANPWYWGYYATVGNIELEIVIE